MSMDFVALKKGLDALLKLNAGAWFVVLEARGQAKSGEHIEDMSQVTSYYDEGSFPKASSSRQGPITHEVTLKIELVVGAKAGIDLSALQNEEATADQRAAALAAMQPACIRADEKLDELVGIVWNIIMDPRQAKLGLAYDTNRWITHIDKSSPLPRGSIAVLSAVLTMTATVQEYPSGEIPVAANSVESGVGLTTDQSGETVDSALQGVEVNL